MANSEGTAPAAGSPSQPVGARRPWRPWRLIRRALLVILLVIVVFAGFLFVRPLGLEALASVAKPSASYVESLSRFKAIQAAEGNGSINSLCLSTLKDHGQKTQNVVVFFHGFTSCPQQWAEFAGLIYDKGFNVLNLRLPQHGAADRLSDMLAGLTAEQLRAFADQAVDIAAGLGDHVYMVGLSGGAVVAAYAGQFRPEVYRTVAIAPFFNAHVVPPPLLTPAINLFGLLPDSWVWYDPVLKDKLVGPNYSYPRYSFHAVAQMLRFAQEVRRGAQTHSPASQSFVFVMLDGDPVVSNEATGEVADLWRRDGYQPLDACVFSADLGLIHDMIDPRSRAPHIDYVYPPLLDLITNPAHGDLPAGLRCTYGTGTPAKPSP